MPIQSASKQMLNTVIRYWLETVIYNVNERVDKGTNSAARINGADKKYSRGMQSEYGDLIFLAELYSKQWYGHTLTPIMLHFKYLAAN